MLSLLCLREGGQGCRRARCAVGSIPDGLGVIVSLRAGKRWTQRFFLAISHDECLVVPLNNAKLIKKKEKRKKKKKD